MLRLHKHIEARRDQRGQAMAEFVIWVFVLLLLIEGIIWFGKAYDMKLQCHLASRYLAWQHAQVTETDFDDALIMDRAQVFYPITDGDPEYLELDSGSIWDPGAATGGADAPTGGGFDMMSLMNGMFSAASNTKGWEVEATYNPNGILNDTLPDGTTVRSRHYVSGGTWHKKQINGDIMIMAVKGGLFAWSVYALSQY